MKIIVAIAFILILASLASALIFLMRDKGKSNRTVQALTLRVGFSVALFLFILLGAVFMGFQAYEYIHAYSELNLKLTSGIYGSTFFMLTGFHGFHVTMGAIMLSVVLYRALRGHFTPTHHFAFEGAAWYWHFVDVVWLGLYVVVYWL